MKKYLIIFLLASTAAFAQCVTLDASTPHYTVAGPDGSCDVAMTPDQIAEKQASDAAAQTAQAVAAATAAIQTAVQTAIVKGIIVTSTATPSLNGTYGLDQINQNNVNATITYILLNGTFPGGDTTMSWIDQLGVSHTWPTIAEFKAFATAYANYVAQVSLYSASNGISGYIPSNKITIP